MVIIASMFLSLFSNYPFQGLTNPNIAHAQAEPTPIPITVPPVVDPHLPSIVVDVTASPRIVTVGDILTVTITLRNQAPDAANNVALTLPLPSGVVKTAGQGFGAKSIDNGDGVAGALGVIVPDAGLPPSTASTASTASPSTTTSPVVSPLVSTSPASSDSTTPGSTTSPGSPTSPTAAPSITPDPTAWNWNIARLDGGAAITQTATMQVTGSVSEGAILASVQATAAELNMPVGRTSGAIVVQPGRSPRTARFTPGQNASLNSYDNKVRLNVPGDIAARPLTFTHGFDPEQGRGAPSDVAGFKRGLGTFYLNAVDDQGVQVHQFSRPLTVTVDYTPQQLQALGIAESDLTLYYFDSTEGVNNWVSVDTQIDQTNHRATASLNHLTPFQLSDGASPSEAYVPSLQGFQTSLYTGSGSYSYPIDVPAGPGASSLGYPSTTVAPRRTARQAHALFSSQAGRGRVGALTQATLP